LRIRSVVGSTGFDSPRPNEEWTADFFLALLPRIRSRSKYASGIRPSLLQEPIRQLTGRGVRNTARLCVEDSCIRWQYGVRLPASVSMRAFLFSNSVRARFFLHCSSRSLERVLNYRFCLDPHSGGPPALSSLRVLLFQAGSDSTMNRTSQPPPDSVEKNYSS
jgi:hypothetical protein